MLDVNKHSITSLQWQFSPLHKAHAKYNARLQLEVSLHAAKLRRTLFCYVHTRTQAFLRIFPFSCPCHLHNASYPYRSISLSCYIIIVAKVGVCKTLLQNAQGTRVTMVSEKFTIFMSHQCIANSTQNVTKNNFCRGKFICSNYWHG